MKVGGRRVYTIVYVDDMGEKGDHMMSRLEAYIKKNSRANVHEAQKWGGGRYRRRRWRCREEKVWEVK